MNESALHWLGRSVAVAAAVLLTGCADAAPVGLDQQAARREQFAPPSAAAASRNDDPVADLVGCEKLRPPAGSKLALRVYAKGVQIYRWNGTSWGFIAPDAVLSSDAEGKSTVGTHYAGPTWESNSGGTLVGAVIERCTPDPNAIQWLLLGAVSEGPGVFHRVRHIQRVNTVGGIAPSNPGTFAGQEARVPYTTEYLFYRPK
jgi:hypothetical protein